MKRPEDHRAIAHSFGYGLPGIPTVCPPWPAHLSPCRNAATGVCNDRGCRGCEERRKWAAKGAKR